MARKYLINFCRSVPAGFRAAELNGLLELFGVTSFNNILNEAKPHAVIESDSESVIHKLLQRSVLIKSATELFASSSNYSDLFVSIRNNRHIVESQVNDTSTFAFLIDSSGKKINLDYQVAKIEEFAFLNIKGSVKLNTPDVCFHVLEYYGTDANNVPDHPIELYFGRLIGRGQYIVPGRYQIKDRKCIGNTSMNPLLAFIAANAASVAPNSLVFDPFVGTGSLLLPVAHFGAYCLGCDINYNLLHGAGKSSRQGKKYRSEDENVRANFEQYGLADKYLDIVIADSSRADLWKKCDLPLFDAIITDPPYGIREKSLKVGVRSDSYFHAEPLINSHPERYPSKVKYSFSDVFLDLLNFAAEKLSLNGRLVYWLPIIYKTFDDSVIPRHSCLELLAKAEQKLSSSHGRLLICMKKIKNCETGEKSYVLRDDFQQTSLRDFVCAKGNV